MSYDLELTFKPRVSFDHFKNHLSARKHFTFNHQSAIYENPDTGVYFYLRFKTHWSFSGRVVSKAEFEINYFRPSYFGLEAEIELSALIARFQPRIFDPQMHGMGEGPYTPAGFLSGWNFGNTFLASNALHRSPDTIIPSVPSETLLAAWRWNYDHDARQAKIGDRKWLPLISFMSFDGRLQSAALWPEAKPGILPPIERVLIGRAIDNKKHYSLVTRQDLLEALAQAGVVVETGVLESRPLHLTYASAPSPLLAWIETLPLISPDIISETPAMETIIDREILDEAARWPQEKYVVTIG